MKNIQEEIRAFIRQNFFEKYFWLLMLWVCLHILKMFLFSLEIRVVDVKSLNQVLYRIFVDSFWTVVLLFLVIRRGKIAFVYACLEAIYLSFYMLYFRYFGSYLMIGRVLNLGEGIKALGTLGVVFSFKYICISFLDWPALILMNFRWNSEKYSLIFKNILMKVFIVLMLLFYILIEVLNFYSGKSIYHAIRYGRKMIWVGKNDFIIRKYGTILYALIGFVDIFHENKVINDLNNSYGNKLEFVAKDKKENFIIIQVESLETSILFQDYKGKAITPFLRKLAKNSWFCPFVLSYHFAGATADAEFSIINSVVPSLEYPSIKLDKYDYPNSFLKRLASNGYRVLAFHNNDRTFFNRDKAFPKMGFHKYYDRIEMGLPHKGWGASDEEVFYFVKDKISRESNNFIYYVITMSSHGPFEYVSLYYTNSIFDDINDKVVRGYFNSMSYVDLQLSNFVTFLEKKFDNLHIIIIGDHCAGIDSKLYKSSSVFVDTSRIELVPMFFIPARNSNLPRSKMFNGVLSFLDVAPSILDLSGVDCSISTYGQSILKLKDNMNRKIPYGGIWLEDKKIIKAVSNEFPRFFVF